MALVNFEYDGLGIASMISDQIPRMDDYVEIAEKDGETSKWRVRSIRWEIDKDGINTEPSITVNLRRLHNNFEWNNQFEASGYPYLKLDSEFLEKYFKLKEHI